MSRASWDLSGHVARLIAFRDERDWRQFHRPKELAAGIAIEAAELQELFLWRDPETAEQVSASPERLARIEEELADVSIYLLMLAHDLGIDLGGAIDRKMAVNGERYDVVRSRGRSDKAPHRPRAAGDDRS
jgi:NTP pyrophosphatase (non-canonical NTP hydrolase)